MDKPDLLFLVHRIPFPPNKGDKIRSFHFLKGLSLEYNVHVGTFIDSKEDLGYQAELKEYCKSIFTVRLYPLYAKLVSLLSLLTGTPLTLGYYKSRSMQGWVDQVIVKHEISRVLIFSSCMAQFVVRHTEIRRVADFIDLDSDKWLQYAKNKPWPLSWLYRREGVTLNAYEKEIAAQFNVTFFVSRYEAQLFKSQLPGEIADKVDFINNGVDYNYFSPDLDYETPYSGEGKKLVFVGAMDYWPNIDAVIWFAEAVFPRLKKLIPTIEFIVVGSNPAEKVKALEKIQGVTVTGRVDDVRPYVAYCDLAIAPLRIARGVQNKVLEALSMNRPIMVTCLALEGIEHDGSIDCFEVDKIDDMAEYIDQVLHDEKPLRDYSCIIKKHYDWDKNVMKLCELIG